MSPHSHGMNLLQNDKLGAHNYMLLVVPAITATRSVTNDLLPIILYTVPIILSNLSYFLTDKNAVIWTTTNFSEIFFFSEILYYIA